MPTLRDPLIDTANIGGGDLIEITLPPGSRTVSVLENTQVPVTVWVEPAAGATMNVRFRTAQNKAWQAWPAGSVSAFTEYRLKSPVQALEFAAGTEASGSHGGVALPTEALWGAGSGPTPTLGAVSLAFVTTDEDLTGANVASWQTPGIAFDLPDSAEVGDVLRVQLNEADLGTRTLDADDIDGPFVDFVAASPGAGTYDMRCRLERGAEISAWSNTLELEILAAPTFSLTKVHEASDGADALSYSFSGCAFGAADPNRVVAVVVMSRGNGLYCTDVTIAGVPATLAARNDPYSSVMIEIWSAPIPAGATGTVSMNMGSASGNASRASISAYRIITSHPEVWDEDIGESGLDGGAGRSMTVTVPAGGAAIVGFTTQTSANSTTWTGATKSAEFNFETFSMHATAIATASGTVTAVPNTSPSSSQILSASWRP
jgi:hypothetical protein